MSKPNIFDISTKELSQDAFITWLLKWADDNMQKEDSRLCACGKAFVVDLMRLAYPEFNEQIKKVEAGRQWNKIDVWAEVNNEYLIIIEDKTNSGERSNQLVRYKKIAEDWCKKQTPKYQPPICVYLKTGNESEQSLESVKDDGFEVYNRQAFVKLLNNHDSKNDIYNDFKNRINRIEKQNYEWEKKIIKEWEGNDWQGFFQFLEKDLKLISWNSVNNPSGGFWNAVLNWNYWDRYPVYLQTEEHKLCFKISTDTEEPVVMPKNVTRSEVRNELSELIIKSAKEKGINSIKTPPRFGNGKYMTVAIVECENWLGNKEEVIDKAQVLNNLKFYKEFLLKEIIDR